MQRSIYAVIVVAVGLVLLVNFVVINPTLVSVSTALLELIVLLAAAAALAGALLLGAGHVRLAAADGPERIGSVVLLAGMAAMLLAGFYPGSDGASDPAVRWLVAALLAPLIASLFGLLFVFALRAAARGVAIHGREAILLVVAAAAVVVLLLPVGGPLGDGLAATAAWTLEVPVGAVFRGLLIGVGLATAVHAARILLSVETTDE